MKSSDFLYKIHGDEKIFFRVISKDRAFNIYGTYKEKQQQLQELNEDGYNVYFLVNSGGTYGYEINKINALFIDLDCGRRENGEYYPLEITQQFKEQCLEKLREFALQPSFIIETRNGVHAYWFVNECTDVNKFTIGQLRLINYFKSDDAVKTPERVMRLPDYYWMKDTNNKFMCKIIQGNDVRYDIDYIIGFLPKCKDEVIPSYAGSFVQPIINNKNYETNIELIKNKDVEGLRKVLFDDNIIQNTPTIDNNIFLSIVGTNHNSIKVNSRDELYDTIKKIDLFEFLGIENHRFNCIFHEDKNPSASIFISEETGDYLYKCHSADCDVGCITIIEIVQRLQGCNIPQAINFIKKVYGIELVMTEWQKKQMQMLQENMEYINSPAFRDEYPNLFKRIKGYMYLISTLNILAIQYTYDEPISEKNDVIFFTSIRHLCHLTHYNDTKRLCQRVNLFTFLGLLEKIELNNIPERFLRESKLQAQLKQQFNSITFYSIPKYNDEILSQAEKNAILYKEKKMTMEGWSRELLLRDCGEEIANRVFPQLSGRPLSEKSQDFSWSVDKIVIQLIQNQGYATEEQILNCLDGSRKQNKRKLKVVLQETIEKYDFISIRANNAIKSKYGIRDRGYPLIIIKDTKSLDKFILDRNEVGRGHNDLAFQSYQLSSYVPNDKQLKNFRIG